MQQLQRLRQARERRGLTQIELAIRAGVAQSVISLSERRGFVPAVSIQQKLARVLGVKPSALFSSCKS